MTRHLQACEARRTAQASSGLDGPAQSSLLHLVVEGRYAPEYWLHLEVPAYATLYDLDDFLRGIWLECCGHMSSFTIEERGYISSLDFWWNDEDSDMRVALGDVLSPGLKCAYEYDFGSTTALTIRVVSERQGTMTGGQVNILARNEPPDIRCDLCGQPATTICTFDEYTVACDRCAESGEFDEEGFLPLVNSPRAGVCGYTGPEDERWP
ncbi:MAG: plasmid pRiA4b ORF-3 family protein [Ardenticatenaceae bacterium]|nr:plasmid pRiA4b ORF-3 family protein [Ardenticatenaceae bacterium]